VPTIEPILAPATNNSLPISALELMLPMIRSAGCALLVLQPGSGSQPADPSTPPLFTDYAGPLLARSPLQVSAADIVYESRFAGLRVAILPQIDRRSSAVHVLVGRTGELPAEASLLGTPVKPIDSDAFNQLAGTLLGLVRSELKSQALQRDLDSLSNQLAETYEELTLIYQLSSGMRVNRTTEEFFLQASMDVMDVMQVQGVGVLLCDPKGNVESNPIYGEVQFSTDVVARLTCDLLNQLRASPRPVLANDLATHATFNYLAHGAQRMLAVPLQRQDQVLGALFCFDKAGDDFNTQDSKLLGSIANETAVFLENATLFADARGLMMGLLHSLTSAVDAKDAYTCGHSQRVALFAKEITRQARLPESLAERVYMAGLLHDVGKIGVSEDVLKKPGKLTDDEFAQMKKHVEIGAKILKDVKQVEDLIPGVLYHHERFDGKGYPHNLSGQQIPLLARILCVADCFDAMTSNRTYRRALPIEVAMMEIRRCSGTQFDPVLADAFLSIGADRLRMLMSSVDNTAARQEAEAQAAKQSQTTGVPSIAPKAAA
jgi:putative nucleotidyltransferase with HDIG domain